MAQLGRRSRAARYYEPYANSTSFGSVTDQGFLANGTGAAEHAYRFGRDGAAEASEMSEESAASHGESAQKSAQKDLLGAAKPTVASSKSRVLTRLGLSRSRGTKVACLALVVILVVCVAWGQLFNSGVTVTRANDGATASQDADASRDGSNQSTEESAAGKDSSNATGEPGVSTTGTAAGKGPDITVHVDGAVVNPGVYVLSAEANRVVDAIRAAGGLSADADTAAINLAAPLSDGVKVHVPKQGEQIADASTGADPSSGSSISTGGTATGSSSGAAGTSASSGASGVVNINTATAEELTALPGVGEATAKAIVEDRQKNGKFQSPEDLMRVSGIGQKKFDKLKDHIRV